MGDLLTLGSISESGTTKAPAAAYADRWGMNGRASVTSLGRALNGSSLTSNSALQRLHIAFIENENLVPSYDPTEARSGILADSKCRNTS